jgi:CHASE3 domain sensor protein
MPGKKTPSEGGLWRPQEATPEIDRKESELEEFIAKETPKKRRKRKKKSQATEMLKQASSGEIEVLDKFEALDIAVTHAAKDGDVDAIRKVLESLGILEERRCKEYIPKWFTLLDEAIALAASAGDAESIRKVLVGTGNLESTTGRRKKPKTGKGGKTVMMEVDLGGWEP